MALGPRLDLRQSQTLTMTPQLQQAIKLLALSNLEIETFIAEELEKNPLLEAERGSSGDDEVPLAPEPDFETAATDPDALPEPAPSLTHTRIKKPPASRGFPELWKLVLLRPPAPGQPAGPSGP